MCRSKDDPLGEYRCNCDSISKRRLRRKTTQEMMKHIERSLTERTVKEKFHEPDENLIVSMEILKQEAKTLKELFKTAPTDYEEAEKFHKEIEERVTSMGMHLAAHIDKDPRIIEAEAELSKVEKKIDEYEQNIEAARRKLYRKFTDLYNLAENETNLSVIEREELSMSTVFDEETLNKLSPEFRKTYEKVKELNDALNVLTENEEEEHKAFRDEQKKVYEQVIQAHQQVTLEYLSNFRDFGGKLKIAGRAPAEVSNNIKNSFLAGRYTKKLLKDSVGNIYPEEWIKESNDTPPPITVGLAKRAGFTSSVAGDDNNYDKEEDSSATLLTYKLDKSSPNTKRIIAALGTAASEIEAGKYSDFMVSETYDEFGKPIYNVEITLPSGEKIPVNKAPYPDEVMREKGWVQSVDIEEADSYITFARDNPYLLEQFINNNKIWVKTEKKKTRQVAALTVDRIEYICKSLLQKGERDPNYAFALHEFGHRMEKVLPNLKAQERAFLERRTGKNKDNWNYNMIKQTISEDGSTEYYHDGGFVLPYVGREYGNGASEVFTVGMEAVFGGNYGMLKGYSRDASRNVSDSDHRGFILGILSSL